MIMIISITITIIYYYNNDNVTIMIISITITIIYYYNNDNVTITTMTKHSYCRRSSAAMSSRIRGRLCRGQGHRSEEVCPLSP